MADRHAQAQVLREVGRDRVQDVRHSVPFGHRHERSGSVTRPPVRLSPICAVSAAACDTTGVPTTVGMGHALRMATTLSVRDRLKRQIGALPLVRQKQATLNDLSVSSAVQAAAALGQRAFDVPVRVVRPEHDDVVVVGLSVTAGGYEKHELHVPTEPMTNEQYADYLEFREAVGPEEALATVL